MASVSSEEESERGGSYSLSADVSESESSNGYAAEGDNGGGASSSVSFSPLTTPTFNFPVIGGKNVVAWDEEPHKRSSDLSEIEMMKERFAKLLLGEDMSGGGKGVCTALAISNAITNLSASVFGEIWRLEPLAPLKKEMWRREMEWLLSISDSIVELIPTVQEFPGGGTYEVMVTRQRSDLFINLPALKKLDAMLISFLDGFQEKEFFYVDRGIVVDDCDEYSSGEMRGRPSVRQEEKWWLPCPKVPCKGLSEDSRKMLQQCRDCTNQILKAALAINGNVLAEMEIPTSYLETLPKNGRDCLGDDIYHYITADNFSPECLLDCLDLSTEHNTLEVANRIEAAFHAWKLKDRKKHGTAKKSKRKPWSGKVKGSGADGYKNHFLALRAETLFHTLRRRFHGLPQTALDMTKIQYNKDVGHSILESYSRVMESLSFNIIARIDDVLYVDDAIKHCAATEPLSIMNREGGFNGMPIQRKMSPSPFSIRRTPCTSPYATPTFCSSPHLPSSPSRFVNPLPNGHTEAASHKFDKVVATDSSRFWSYAGNLSPGRVPHNGPERD